MGRSARDRLTSRAATLAAGDPFVSIVARHARPPVARILLVGGALRDLALGRVPRDLDFIAAGRGAGRAVAAVAREAGRRLVTFRKRGLVNHRITYEGRDHDFVQVRDGALRAELARRDFTVNAVAWDLVTGRLLDPRGGLDDLSRRILRAGPDGVFRDDPLRMVRAVRLCGDLPRFSIARRTVSLIRRDARLVARCSPERVRDELDRVLLGLAPSGGISRLDRLGLLERLLPEIAPLKGLAQNRYHHLDAWRHTLAALREADDPAALGRPAGLGREAGRLDEDALLVLRWSLLLHDLGKADTVSVTDEGNVHFFGHEKTSARHAARILKRLRFATRRARAVRRLIELHLRVTITPEGTLSDRACRRIIRDAGDLTPLLVLHSLADKQASRGTGWREAQRLLARSGRKLVQTYRRSRDAVLSPPVLIDGHDVMRILGRDPGPEVGRVLDAVRALQIEGEIATRADALEAVLRMEEGEGAPPDDR